MEYKVFIEIALNLQKNSKEVHSLYKLGVDLLNFPIFERYEKIVNLLLEEVYTEEGIDWISWYFWENDFGQGTLTASDENKNPICYSFESLWEYIEKNCKKL